MGYCHCWYRRLRPSRREALLHPELRPDLHRSHLDPLVLDHQAPKRPVRKNPAGIYLRDYNAFWCLIAPVLNLRGSAANSVTHTASLPSTSSSPLSVSSRSPVSPSTTPPPRTGPPPWLRRSSRKSRRVSRLPRMPSRLRGAEHPGQ